MFKASQTIALSFPSLLLAAIASTSSVSANEINPTVEKISNSSNQLVNITNTNVDGNRKLIDEVTNVSELGLKTPLPISAQQELSSTPVPFEQLSNSQVGLSSQSSDLAQVTSVSQLTDVRPNDWAFTALQSLVERYGVIAGYPDSTYRGKQALTRYEFAAGLN
ncbi:MAG: iron uptake porin, partial [Pseudanabaena sp.]